MLITLFDYSERGESSLQMRNLQLLIVIAVIIEVLKRASAWLIETKKITSPQSYFYHNSTKNSH